LLNSPRESQPRSSCWCRYSHATAHPARRRPPTQLAAGHPPSELAALSLRTSSPPPATELAAPDHLRISPPPATHGSRRPAPYFVTGVHWLDARPPAETPPCWELAHAALTRGRLGLPCLEVGRAGPWQGSLVLYCMDLADAGPWRSSPALAPGRSSPVPPLAGGRPRRPCLEVAYAGGGPSWNSTLRLCAPRACCTTRPTSRWRSIGSEGTGDGDAATHARGFLFPHLFVFIMWG
jgi:hypothetical protein